MGYRTPAQAGRLNSFLDTVSEGVTPTEAGRALGMTKQAVSKLWKRVCRDLGEQAA